MQKRHEARFSASGQLRQNSYQRLKWRDMGPSCRQHVKPPPLLRLRAHVWRPLNTFGRHTNDAKYSLKPSSRFPLFKRALSNGKAGTARPCAVRELPKKEAKWLKLRKARGPQNENLQLLGGPCRRIFARSLAKQDVFEGPTRFWRRKTLLLQNVPHLSSPPVSPLLSPNERLLLTFSNRCPALQQREVQLNHRPPHPHLTQSS